MVSRPGSPERSRPLGRESFRRTREACKGLTNCVIGRSFRATLSSSEPLRALLSVGMVELTVRHVVIACGFLRTRFRAPRLRWRDVLKKRSRSVSALGSLT